MLAVVKKPRIEIALSGEDPVVKKPRLRFTPMIRRKFEVNILTPWCATSVPVEDTDFWRDMNQNRAGNLLAGARLKAEMTQVALAEKTGIRQNMVSEYENGKRALTPAMVRRFSRVLGVDLMALLAGHERAK